MGAVMYRFRADLRQRWAAWLLVALLVGIAGGVVLALFAGARRTASAYDRLVEANEAYDVLLIKGIPGMFEFAPLDLDAIARRPDVQASAPMRVIPLVGLTSDGTFISPEQTNVRADPTGRLGTTLNRVKVLEGRRAHPDRVDEVVANLPAAEQLSLDVGDTLKVNVLNQEELGQVFGGAGFEAVMSRDLVELTVVGIVVAPNELPPQANPTVDIEMIYVTPALLAANPDAVGVDALAVRLNGGAGAAPRFLAELQRGNDLPVAAGVETEQTRAVNRALQPLARALVLAGLLASAVAVLIVGQLVVRQSFVEGRDLPVLRALGFSAGEQRRLRLLKGLVIGVVGAAVAAFTALVLSPLFPIGLARAAEPSPGRDADVPVLLLGGVGVLLAGVLVAVATEWLGGGTVLASPTRGHDVNLAEGHLPVIRRLAGAVRGAVLLAGTRLATGRRGAKGGIVGAALGVLTVVGVATFAASLDDLRDTPRLYGWTWDVTVGGDFAEPLSPEGIARLARDPEVRSAEVGAFLDLEIAGHRLRTLAVEPVRGDIEPALLEGRAPRGADEVVLGPKAAASVDVGDRARLASGGQTAEVEVVGRAVLPDVDLLIPFAVAQTLHLETTPQLALIHVTPGTDADALADRVAADLGLRGTSVERPQLPQDLVNFGRADATPAIVAGLMALVAVATLLHALLTAVQRERRTLAVLRAIGFTRSQLVRSVTVQAWLLVIPALLVALPLGVAAGRWAWMTFAQELGVIPQATIPLPALAAIAAVSLVISGLVAIPPGWQATRVAPARVLRPVE